MLKNAQDIKLAQDTVAQDASFFVGNVLQQKKNYSLPFSCKKLLIHVLQKKLLATLFAISKICKRIWKRV